MSESLKSTKISQHYEELEYQQICSVKYDIERQQRLVIDGTDQTINKEHIRVEMS